MALIPNTGGGGTSSTPKTRTLIIKAGETGIIPSTAKIISVGISGNADAESDCPSVDDALNNSETYQCYEFVWEADVRGGGFLDPDSGSWEIEGVYLEAVEMDQTTYEIEIVIDDIDQTTPGLAGKIKQVVPSSVMKLGDNVKGEAWFDQLGDNKATQAICFQALPSVADKLRLKFRNFAGNGNEGDDPVYYVYPRPLSKQKILIEGQASWCACSTTTTTT